MDCGGIAPHKIREAPDHRSPRKPRVVLQLATRVAHLCVDLSLYFLQEGSVRLRLELSLTVDAE
jgi:hypothetical protein